MPAAVPYVSAQDIDKGARWSSDIASELKDTSIGIICVTRENTNEPWIHFEAGALSKALDTARVCPLLLDLRPTDLDRRSPLLQFQATGIEEADIKQLVTTINRQTARPSEATILEKQFRAWWPDLRHALEQVTHSPATQKQEGQRTRLETMVEEILEHTRASRRESGIARHQEVDPPIKVALELQNLAQHLERAKADPGRRLAREDRTSINKSVGWLHLYRVHLSQEDEAFARDAREILRGLYPSDFGETTEDSNLP